MTPCKFSFDDGPDFDGFDLGTRWNGWANVAVTEAVRDQIADWFDGQVEPETNAELRALPVVGGLVSLADGYAVTVTPAD